MKFDLIGEFLILGCVLKPDHSFLSLSKLLRQSSVASPLFFDLLLVMGFCTRQSLVEVPKLAIQHTLLHLILMKSLLVADLYISQLPRQYANLCSKFLSLHLLLAYFLLELHISGLASIELSFQKIYFFPKIRLMLVERRFSLLQTKRLLFDDRVEPFYL